MREFGIYARVGIGPNKALAKMACDHFAKNASGIHRLDMSNIRQDLWPLPVGKLFGIGKRMEHHLRRMGISTIGGLAGHPAELLKNAGALTANCFSGQPAASIPLRSPSTRTAGKSDRP